MKILLQPASIHEVKSKPEGKEGLQLEPQFYAGLKKQNIAYLDVSPQTDSECEARKYVLRVGDDGKLSIHELVRPSANAGSTSKPTDDKDDDDERERSSEVGIAADASGAGPGVARDRSTR